MACIYRAECTRYRLQIVFKPPSWPLMLRQRVCAIIHLLVGMLAHDSTP